MLSLAALLVTLAPAAPAETLDPVSPFEVEGVVAGSLRMRLVSTRGEPVSGAAVTLFSQAPGWGGAVRLVAAAASDAAGEVHLADLVSDHAVYLVVQPGPAFRPRYLPVPGICAGTLDLGALELEDNLQVSGRVLQGDGEQIVAEGMIRLLTRDDEADVVAYSALEGDFLLENFPRVPLWIEVRPGSSYKTPSVRYAWDPDPEVEHLELLLRVVGETLELERATPVPAGRVPAPTYRFAGRVTFLDGRPAVGLPVELAGGLISDRPLEAEAYGLTDGDGRFSLWTRNDRMRRVRVRLPEETVQIDTEADPTDAADSREDASAQQGAPLVPDPGAADDLAIVLPVAGALAFDVRGVDPELVDWAFLAWGEWVEATREVAGHIGGERRQARVLRATAPGHLPHMLRVAADATDVVVDFTRDERFTLEVHGADGPLGGATVELLARWDTELSSAAGQTVPREQRIVRRITGTAGELAFLWGTEQRLFARVTARGHDPVLRQLLPGETRVKLAPRRGHAVFEEVPAGGVVRVKPRGREALVAYVRARESGDVRVPLAPGAYEASLTLETDGLVWGRSFEVVGAQSVELDRERDDRPRVRIALPELPPVPEADQRWYRDAAGDPAVDHWWVWASRSVLPGGGVGAMASTHSGRWAEAETPAVTSVLEDGRRELVLSGSGRWLLLAGSERTSLEATFFREVNLAPGEVLEVEIQALDQALRGSMSGFSSGSGFSQHGVAGPRLELLPDPEGGGGWGAVVSLPKRVGEGPEFSVAGLPAGSYLLRHHLTASAGLPLGGRAIVLGADEAPAADFEQWPRGTFTVRVQSAEGELVHGARLTVRDRLSEAWSAYTRIPSTGSFASRPIPSPPDFRLEGEPVRLPEVQTGWMEFRVEADDGRRWEFVRSVDPEETLVLTLRD